VYIVSKLISVSARKSQLYYHTSLNELGITTGQYMYLVSLCENEGVSQEKLGGIIGINKSTTAKVISQLMEEGFVSRQQDPVDKRGYKVYPTEKAKQLYPMIINVLDQWNENLMEGFSEEEQRTLFQLMSRVEENARKHCK